MSRPGSRPIYTATFLLLSRTSSRDGGQKADGYLLYHTNLLFALNNSVFNLNRSRKKHSIVFAERIFTVA